MFNTTRRGLIRTGLGLAAGSTLISPFITSARAGGHAMFAPEAGAEITLLRWKRFVQSEEDAFMKLAADFTAKTGVKVNVVSESLDDVQPKASVAANVGQGPDMVWGLYSLPHLFPDKLVDLTDLADALGKAHGGWVDAAQTYGVNGGKWISIPVAFNGNYINYRKSSVEKAGFKTFPTDTAGLLDMMKALKANGTPGGFALGHASGDGNAWTHWALWSHGASLVNEKDELSINSEETKAACEYVKQIYEASIEGTAAWNDSFNNKAFLAGDLHLTNNGISIYAAAKAGANPKADAEQAVKDLAPKMAALAEDIDHGLWPIGPAGKPTEFQIAYPMSVFQYSKYPMACKAFIEFMLSPDAYNGWLEGAVGYLTQPLNAYESHPVWTADPKRTVFRDAAKRTLTAGYKGSVGERAAAALAEFVVLDMFANYATGRTDLAEAIKQAERQARRIYR